MRRFGMAGPLLPIQLRNPAKLCDVCRRQEHRTPRRAEPLTELAEEVVEGPDNVHNHRDTGEGVHGEEVHKAFLLDAETEVRNG